VDAGSVELRGNDAIAFAKVEMRIHGKNSIGADPVLVVLRREQSRRKAFSVSSEILSIEALPDLARLAFRPATISTRRALAVPRLVYPDDGGRHGEGGRSFAWEIAGDTPLAAQICEILLDDKESHCPASRLKVFPADPRTRALHASEKAALELTGVRAAQMRWCVWAVGVDGSISTSEVRSYRPMEFKYWRADKGALLLHMNGWAISAMRC
jgi:hypothetical protein